MYYEKWDLLTKLLGKGIKPTNPEFEKSVVSLLKEKIGLEFHLDYVSPETLAKVDQQAKDFKHEMKKLWSSKTVSTYSPPYMQVW